MSRKLLRHGGLTLLTHYVVYYVLLSRYVLFFESAIHPAVSVFNFGESLFLIDFAASPPLLKPLLLRNLEEELPLAASSNHQLPAVVRRVRDGEVSL